MKQAVLETHEREAEGGQPKDAMLSLMNRIRELQNIKQHLEEKIAAKEKEQAAVQKHKNIAAACF